MFCMKTNHSGDLNFSLIGKPVWMYKAILSTAVAKTLLCKLNYGYHNLHIFTSILQMEHISGVKFPIGDEKNTIFLFLFVSPELSSVRDYVITHSVRSMY